MMKTTEEQPSQLKICRDLGLTWRKTLKKVGLTSESIARTIYKYYMENGGTGDAKRSGRPAKLGYRNQRQLKRMMASNNRTSWRK